MKQRRVRAVIALLLLFGAAATTAQAQRVSDTLYWDTAWTEGRLVNALPQRVSGMVEVTKTLSVDIEAPRDTVYDIYANVYSALGLHPYLRDIIAIRCNANTFDFTALEDVPVGRVVLPLKTVARQEFHAPDFYTTETYDRPLTLTHQIVRFTPLSAHSTRVVEELTFEALPLLISIAVSGGVQAHAAVQQGLKQAIEAGVLTPVPYPAYLPIACSGAG